MSLKTLIISAIDRPITALFGISGGTLLSNLSSFLSAQAEAKQTLISVAEIVGALGTILIACWWARKWVIWIYLKYQSWRRKEPVFTQSDLD